MGGNKFSGYWPAPVLLAAVGVLIVAVAIFLLLPKDGEPGREKPVVEPYSPQELAWEDPPVETKEDLRVTVRRVLRVYDFARGRAEGQAFLEVQLHLKDLQDRPISRYARIAPVVLRDDLGYTYHNRTWETHLMPGEEGEKGDESIERIIFPLPARDASTVTLEFRTRVSRELEEAETAEEWEYIFEDLPLP